MIWQYAPNKAKSIFERDSLDVSLYDAEGFFRATAVIAPEVCLDEYGTMPEAGSNEVDHRIYVRNVLLPALTQKTAEDFLAELLKFQGLEIPSEIVQQAGMDSSAS